MTSDILVIHDVAAGLAEWSESDTLILVDVTEVVEDQGTVVIMAGAHTLGPGYIERVRFAVDNEVAEVLITGIDLGEWPQVAVEPWQVL